MNGLHMKTHRLTLWILCLGLVAAACSAPTAPTADPDQVATEVSQMLTEMPSATPAPSHTAPPQDTPTSVPDTPTATETASATPTATSTTTATATPPDEDPRELLGDPTWRDPLGTGDSWGLFEDEHTRVSAGDGTLVLTALNPDNWSAWTLSWARPDDFYLEATTRTGECTGLDRHGLVFRADDSDRAYLFGLSCDGRYSLRLWDGEALAFTTLIDWTISEHVRAGSDQTNRLGVLAEGERLAVYANGHYLAEAQEDSYDEGAFGLFIASANTTSFTVWVDEVAYWNLP